MGHRNTPLKARYHAEIKGSLAKFGYANVMLCPRRTCVGHMGVGDAANDSTLIEVRPDLPPLTGPKPS